MSRTKFLYRRFKRKSSWGVNNREKGETISKDLPIGNYSLVEIEAPKGYELLKDKVAVKVEKDKVIEMKIGNKKLPDQ